MHDEWTEVHGEDTRSLDSVNVKSFSISVMTVVIMKQFEASSKHVRCKIMYKIDMHRDGYFPTSRFIQEVISKHQCETTSKLCVCHITYCQAKELCCWD